MSLLKPNNYLSIAPQVKVSVALEIWDPISNEFPRDDAVGPGLHFQKPGCRLLLICPCSLILKKHHQAYWEMFHLFKIIGFLKDCSSMCKLFKRMWGNNLALVCFSFKKANIFIIFFALFNVHVSPPNCFCCSFKLWCKMVTSLKYSTIVSCFLGLN